MCYAAIPYVMAAMAAYGAYSSAASQKAQAGYQAKVAENNANIAELQAQDAKARGDKASFDVRRKYAALMGTQRASLAARGLDITDGSANAILQDTAYFGAYDENTTRANAAREAWGYRVRAAGMQSDASAYSATADAINPLLSGGLAGAGTWFSSAQSVDPKWYRGEKPYAGNQAGFYGGNGTSGD